MTPEKRPLPMSEIVDSIRKGGNLSPKLQAIVDQNRQHFEARSAAYREVFEGFHRNLAALMGVDPGVFAKVSDSDLEELIVNGVSAAAVKDLADVKIRLTIASEVSAGGCQLHDEHDL